MLDAFSQAVVDASPAGFWVGSGIAAIAAVFTLRLGLRAFSNLRVVLDTPTAKIRSAAQGQLELQGHAHPDREPLAARLTGIPCVWYRYRIEERRRSGKHENWITVEKGDAKRPFLLDDGTGRCLVEPTGADLHCRDHDRWYSGRRGGSPNAPSGAGWPGLFAGRRRYRMSEERIAPGAYVYVMGHFETPRRGVRQRQQLTRQLLSQWKRDPERMRAFDLDGDNQISPDEWEQARDVAQRVAALGEQRISAQAPQSRITRGPDPRHPFVISTEGEEALVTRLRLRSLGGTAIGVLMAAVTAFALLARWVR